MLATGSVQIVAVKWWVRFNRPPVDIRTGAWALLGFIALLGLLTVGNSAFRQTLATSTSRTVDTIPNLIKGTPDPSFASRLAEYEGVELNALGNPAKRNTEWTSEFLILLTRFGIFGLLLSWQIWMMLFTRATRAANSAQDRAERLLGVMGSMAVVAGMVSAFGAGSILEPSRMVIIVATVALVPVVKMYALRSDDLGQRTFDMER